MLNQFSRTELLLGHDNMEKLKNARVAVFGIGGVGGFTVEALARSGVGTLDLIDDDRVCLTNINRQIIATRKTIGQYKVDAAKERILDINPDAVVNTYKTFFMPDTADAFDFSVYDYVVDAIDTIAPKCTLIEECLRRRIPVVCSMGAGAKTDITQVRFADIFDTYHCGLSKAVRNRLKADGFKHARVPVVFCTQQPDRQSVVVVEGERNKKSTTGTVSFMPAVFGCYLAQYVLERI